MGRCLVEGRGGCGGGVEVTAEEFRAAAERSAHLVRQLAYHRGKVAVLQEELDELTARMFLFCGG